MNCNMALQWGHHCKPSWWVIGRFWGPVLSNTVFAMNVQTWQITTCHFVVHPMCFQGPWRPIPPMCLWKGLTSTTLSPMCPSRTLITYYMPSNGAIFLSQIVLFFLWENGFLSLCATSWFGYLLGLYRWQLV